MAIKSQTLGEIIYLKWAAENSPSSCHLANLRDGYEPSRPTLCSFKHFSKWIPIWNSSISSLKWKALVKRAISLTLGNNTYVYIWNSFWQELPKFWRTWQTIDALELKQTLKWESLVLNGELRFMLAVNIYCQLSTCSCLLLWQRTLPASQRASDEETQTDHTPTWCKFSTPCWELCGLLSLTDHYPACNATVFETSAYMSVMEYGSFSTGKSCPHTSRTTAS